MPYSLRCPIGISDGPALPPALGLPLLETRSEPPPSPAPLLEGKTGRSPRPSVPLCLAWALPLGEWKVSPRGDAGEVNAPRACLSKNKKLVIIAADSGQLLFISDPKTTNSSYSIP